MMATPTIAANANIKYAHRTGAAEAHLHSKQTHHFMHLHTSKLSITARKVAKPFIQADPRQCTEYKAEYLLDAKR